MNKITIEVDGLIYENFMSISIKEDMTELTGIFTLIATNENISVKNITDFPIKSNSLINMYIDDVPVLRGYVNIRDVIFNAKEYKFNIEGRDITQDLADSSLQKNPEFNNKISLKAICENVIKDLGIPTKSQNKSIGIDVINEVSDIQDFEESEIASGGVDESIFEFLNKLAMKRQVLLSTNGTGDLVIARNSQTRSSGELRSIANDIDNNVISGTRITQNDNTFNTYNIFSQDNASSGIGGDTDIANKEGSITDSNIRTTRKVNIISDNSSDIFTCEQRAIWEKNFRIADADSFTVSVQGFYANEENKELWKKNTLVNTRIDFLGIYDDMLIKNVTFTETEDGVITILEIVNKEAYTLELELEKVKILGSEEDVF